MISQIRSDFICENCHFKTTNHDNKYLLGFLNDIPNAINVPTNDHLINR